MAPVFVLLASVLSCWVRRVRKLQELRGCKGLLLYLMINKKIIIMKNTMISSEVGLSRVELVYRKLKTNIVENEFPPGFQALEPEIAKDLGVSRTPVREALIRLEAENLIELIPRRGMRVLPLNPTDILEIHQTLAAMEFMAFDLLKRLASHDEVFSRLAECIVSMQRAIEDDELAAWSDADEAFHRNILVFSGNTRLMRLAEITRSQFKRTKSITLKLRPRSSLSTAAHEQVLSLMKGGDWENAQQAHYQNRLQLAELLVELFGRYKFSHL